MSSVCGITYRSRGGLKGIGTPRAPTRPTGASSRSHSRSARVAATSAPNPPNRHASCATTALRVRLTESSTRS
jgi:hypothetical protein